LTSIIHTIAYDLLSRDNLDPIKILIEYELYQYYIMNL